jgi:hypothetical protein
MAPVIIIIPVATTMTAMTTPAVTAMAPVIIMTTVAVPTIPIPIVTTIAIPIVAAIPTGPPVTVASVIPVLVLMPITT